MFEDMNVWRNIFYACMILSASSALAFTARVFYLRQKMSTNKSGSHQETSDSLIDLMNYPDDKIIKAFAPKPVSLFGISCFFFVFGLSGTMGINSQFPFPVVLVIAFCLSVTGAIAVAMLQYALRLKLRSDIVFVPKTIGLIGKVIQDIPAAERGEGMIRLAMNGMVADVCARSVDEVILAKGTDVKILYAYSDVVVVVERYSANLS